jgi:DNA primase
VAHAQADIDAILRETAVQRLAEARGVTLEAEGDVLVGVCPFHAQDSGDRLTVHFAANTWSCTACSVTGGSVIDWLMRAEGVSRTHAVELLRAGKVTETDGPARKKATRELKAFAPEEPDAVVLRRVADFYHESLKQCPEALAYLGSRGIESAELVETFKLGFSNRTLGYRLPPKAVKAGAAIRAQLQRLGIVRESGHEHFRGSIVVPIFDDQGVLIEMYGRKITPGLRPGTPLHMYLPGPHRGVFNLTAFKASKDIILCEALIDALTFWSAGYRNVTSAYGVDGFTSELREAFGAHDIERVLIAYDADEAGNRAAEKLAPELAAIGLTVFRVQFPRGMDANEYALKLKPAEKSLGTALRAAYWMAGGRAVSVPAELTEAHALNQAIAETNGRDSGLRAREVEPARGEPPSEAHPLAAPLEARPEHNAVENGEEVMPASVPHSLPQASSAPPPPPWPRQPTAELHVEASDEQVMMQLGDRKWRVRGLAKNLSPTQLKVNVMVARGAAFFVDQLEMNSARQRALFITQAAKEIEAEERVLKRDMGLLFQKLEELQDRAIQKALEPKAKAVPEMSETERKEALALLKDAKLLNRILADFESAGVVGEETNKLVGYLAAVSRKLPAPLGVVIQSTSAAGKSSLMDAVLSFMPEEERVRYSAMTGQSLYYMGEVDLQHKILAIAEEEGASNASYALKLLQSEGELTIASTGKNPADGRLITQEYQVTGPVMVMTTTTAIELDEELMNRCVVLTVDDGREQTRAIHEKQREAQTIEGILARQDRGAVIALHQNAQRLLKPLTVANPFAKELRFVSHATRTRRDHAKYLTLINTIALLHQHQRPVKEVEHRGGKVRYIEVTRDDIAVADRLVEHVLTRSMDELSPQTRGLLRVIDTLVKERAEREGIERSDVRFTQREVRERASLGLSQLKVHMRTLLDHEFLMAHRAGHAQRHVYELVCSALEGAHGPFEYGLDRPVSSAHRPVILTDRPASSRSVNRPVSSNALRILGEPAGDVEGCVSGDSGNDASYTSASSYPTAGKPDTEE